MSEHSTALGPLLWDPYTSFLVREMDAQEGWPLPGGARSLGSSCTELSSPTPQPTATEPLVLGPGPCPLIAAYRGARCPVLEPSLLGAIADGQMVPL